MEEKKSYYAIIPANVRYDESLCANAKLLYGEITALCNETGFCWARNRYFAELYGVTNITISRWLKQLSDSGYIKTQITYDAKTKEILERTISLNVNTYLQNCYEGINKNDNTPINKIVKDNNTIMNNTLNIKENVKKKFVPPTLDEVVAYCKERKNYVDAQKFFDYFEASGWVDSKGNKVKNWKQKIITWEQNTQPNPKQEYMTHNYTKEQCNSLIDDLDEVEI